MNKLSLSIGWLKVYIEIKKQALSHFMRTSILHSFGDRCIAHLSGWVFSNFHEKYPSFYIHRRNWTQ